MGDNASVGGSGRAGRSRRVVVTGGARGIGHAIACAFLALGDEVSVVDIEPYDLVPGQGLSFHQCDLADAAAVQRIAGELLATGPVDVLVNNAAVSLGGNALTTTSDLWERTLAVNLTAPFVLSQAVMRSMVEHGVPGVILFITSVNAFHAEHDALPYVVSKHGLTGLMRAMAVDAAGSGIRLNAVAPGPVRTERNAAILDRPNYRSSIERGVPLGRSGRPEEVAATVVAMADPGFSYVQGATLTVDGGYTAYNRFD
jgi:NAD(P)-dependent dehydrogenase (short-subunit alcohol dehydrogenase family)